MKYYTAFVFDHDSPYHVTHKYLGSLSDEKAEEAWEVCLDWLNRIKPGFPHLWFSERAYFGPGGQTPVLLPAEHTKADFDFWPELRARLSHLRPDNYGEYRPHVSVGPGILEYANQVIGYALMSGTQVVKLWPSK